MEALSSELSILKKRDSAKEEQTGLGCLERFGNEDEEQKAEHDLRGSQKERHSLKEDAVLRIAHWLKE